MNNFKFQIPTRIHFGKGAISNLSELKEYGKKVLLVYGGGSIKKNGIYNEIINICKDNGYSVTPLNSKTFVLVW